jgi:hypothetical protein
VGGGETISEVVGDNGGIGDAKGYAFCWNRERKQLGFGASSSHVDGQCGFGGTDGLKGWADNGGSSHFYGWRDGEGDVGAKAAEELSSRRRMECNSVTGCDGRAGWSGRMDGCLGSGLL